MTACGMFGNNSLISHNIQFFITLSQGKAFSAIFQKTLLYKGYMYVSDLMVNTETHALAIE